MTNSRTFPITTYIGAVIEQKVKIQHMKRVSKSPILHKDIHYLFFLSDGQKSEYYMKGWKTMGENPK